LANIVGGTKTDNLKQLYINNREEYIMTLMELKKSEIAEYIISPEKKMLIVGAEPTQHEKFIIPSDFKPIYIETDFGGSTSNSSEIMNLYEIQKLTDFPLLILPIESFEKEIPGLKFDLIIFDKSVCYWLNINKSFIDYLISLKKERQGRNLASFLIRTL